MSSKNTPTSSTKDKASKKPNINSFSLDENRDIRATGEGLTADIKLEEILFLPKAPNGKQEVWVLDDAQYAIYKELTTKYNNAAKELADVRNTEKPDSEQLKVAQDKMRKMILVAEGKTEEEATKKSNETASPIPTVPQGNYQGITEGIGFRNEQYFYLGVKDLERIKKAQKNKSKIFQFPVKLTPNTEETATAAYDAAYPEEKTTKEKIAEFKQLKAAIQEKWEIIPEKKGQVPSKVLSYGSPILQAFLTDDDFELIDTWVEDFNKNSSASWNNNKEKVQTIILELKTENASGSALSKEKQEDFSDEDWAKVESEIRAIWAKTNGKFIHDSLSFEKKPNISQRQKLVEDIKKQPLPPVCWDASAGAQLMRYAAGMSAEAGYNLAEGKVFGKLGGEAKFSALEAGAEFNAYLPNDKGWRMKFDIPVKKTTYSFKEDDTYDASLGYNPNLKDGSFPFDSFLVMPSVVLSLVQQLDIAKKTISGNEFGKILFNIIGHTDAKGSNKYNDKLGLLRASAAHALFSDDAAEWGNYFEFKKNAWGEAEEEFMFYSSIIAKDSPSFFEGLLFNDNVTIDSKEDLINITEQLKKENERITIDLEEVIVVGKKNPKKLTRAEKKYFAEQKKFGRKTALDSMIRYYFTDVLNIALSKVSSVKHEDLKQFFFTESEKSVRSLGKRKLIDKTQEKSSKNRRVELQPFRAYDPKTEIVDEPIDFGDGRFKFKGGVSLFVGATLALSAEVEINAPYGTLMTTGKKTPDATPVKYDNGTAEDSSNDGDNNATAKADAFAGAQAEASVALELEWQNPDNRGKPSGGFKTLASVGYAVTASAGAGIAGEFKIGFDRETKKFQIKMMAKATWGIGCGGSASFTIGAGQLWDFVRVVYFKISQVEFNFLDLFEQEKDKDGNETDSQVNVYEVFTAWSVEMLKKGYILEAGLTYVAGGALDGALDILQDVDNLLDKWQNENQELNDIQTLVESLKKEPELIDYLLPEAKGRILYLLTKGRQANLATFADMVGDSWKDFKAWDKNFENEEAAIFLVTKGISSAEEWRETMEHMTYRITNSQGENEYVAFIKSKDTSHYGADALSNLASKTVADDETIKQKAAEKQQHIQFSIVYLKNYLLNDLEDWEKVERHVKKLFRKEKESVVKDLF